MSPVLQFLLGAGAVSVYLMFFGLTLALMTKDGTDDGEAFVWSFLWPITWAVIITGLVLLGPAYLVFKAAGGKE